jgi:hypothetical protein
MVYLPPSEKEQHPVDYSLPDDPEFMTEDEKKIRQSCQDAIVLALLWTAQIRYSVAQRTEKRIASLNCVE